eukprot:jgi/Ulvmu1/1384/UM011_0112.1
MRVVIQRVKTASVTVDGAVVSRIGKGLVCLVGLKSGDGARDTEVIVRKILGTRLFHDEESGKRFKTNVVDEAGEILCISQFTLYGRAKSKSPDFTRSMGAAEAQAGYDTFLDTLKSEYVAERVKDGVFGAMMDVALVNDGPVTLVIDSDGSIGINN